MTLTATTVRAGSNQSNLGASMVFERAAAAPPRIAPRRILFTDVSMEAGADDWRSQYVLEAG